MRSNVHGASIWGVEGTVRWGNGSCEDICEVLGQILMNMDVLLRTGNETYWVQPDRLRKRQ